MKGEKTMSGLGYISKELPKRCELCGRVKELRPYGPNGEDVCFECGMENEKAMGIGFERLIEGSADN